MMAKNWHKVIRPYTIGITGSMGKTSTSQLLATLLPEAVVTDVNLDTLYNIPITALKLRPDTKVAIFEYGIDQKGEMDKHLEVVKPNAVIVTGITTVHTDEEHLGSLENLIKEKQKLVHSLKHKDIAILNYDDENVRSMATDSKANVLFFGSDKSKCIVSYNPKATKISTSGTSYEIVDNETGVVIPVNTKLIGTQFVYNIMAAYLAYKNYQLSKGEAVAKIIEEFKLGVSKVQPLSGRMSFEQIAGISILNDSLRSNPISVVNGLNTFALVDIGKGKKVVVLGEMGELGESAEFEHKEVGKLIAELKRFDFFIGIGGLVKLSIASAIENGFSKENTYYAQNALEAGEYLKKILHKGDALYLKGSLLRHLERVLMKLNNETVSCDLVSCPLYNSCKVCRYRNGGYVVLGV